MYSYLLFSNERYALCALFHAVFNLEWPTFLWMSLTFQLPELMTNEDVTPELFP